MIELIEVEIDGQKYQLTEELVSWMVSFFLEINSDIELSDSLEESFLIDSQLLEDVRLILDELVDSEIGD